MNTPLWDNHAWQALPALESDTSADVCVIGLGGSGLAAILELLQNGADVIGIDAQDVGAGAAGRNGGFVLAGLKEFYHHVAAQLGRKRAAAMYAATLEEILRLRGLTPNAILQTGSLRIATSPDEFEDCALQLSALQQDGFAVLEYQGSEGVGLLFPQDCAMNPLLRVRELAKLAQQKGARLFGQSRALEIGSGLVRGGRFTIRAKKIIVAVDGKLEAIFPELAQNVRTARLQMLGAASLNTTPLEPRFPRPVYARFGYEYWQQLPDGCVVLGGFRDHFELEEWTLEDTPTKALQAHLERFLRQNLGVTAPITHRWAASVSYSSGLLPVLRQVRPSVWALGGYSGTGNVVGSIFGRIAAQLALGQESELQRIFLDTKDVA
jgi:gamma-glutamylputrescine oxidase